MNVFFRTLGPLMILAGFAFAASNLLGNRGADRWSQVAGGLAVILGGVLFLIGA